MKCHQEPGGHPRGSSGSAWLTGCTASSSLLLLSRGSRSPELSHVETHRGAECLQSQTRQRGQDNGDNGAGKPSLGRNPAPQLCHSPTGCRRHHPHTTQAANEHHEDLWGRHRACDTRRGSRLGWSTAVPWPHQLLVPGRAAKGRAALPRWLVLRNRFF